MLSHVLSAWANSLFMLLNCAHLQVFKKDNGPPTENHIHGHTVKYVAPVEGGFGGALIGALFYLDY